MTTGGGGQRGAVLPVVALSLLLLMIVAAIVIDLGNGRQIRRQAQNAVDAAALAAVVDYAETAGTETDKQTAATARAVEYVGDNGFPPSNTTINTTFSTNASGHPCVTVEIDGYLVTTYFGRVIGADQLHVSAVSTACRADSPTNLPGLFAGGQDCEGNGKAFTVSGNDNRMEGDLHSNRDAKEAGNFNVRSGVATYVSPPVDISGSPDHWWQPATQVTARPWPLTFNLADYQPGGVRAVAAGDWYRSFTSDLSLSGNVDAGLYYTTGKITLDNVTIVPRTISGVPKTGATFVTGGGVIEVTSNSVIHPFQDEPERLTLFAGWQEKSGGARCDSETLKLSGNCIHFDGIAYVPHGKFRSSAEGNGQDYVDGSSQCSSRPHQPTFEGAVLAYAVEISGNYNLYRGTTSPSTDGEIYLSD